MPREIDRSEVQRLAAAGAQVVDVLSRTDFEQEHIAGAINLPLDELNRQTATVLRRDRPVVVYCDDYQ